MTGPSSGDSGSLEGELLGFRFVKDDGSWAVARVRAADGREVVAVGPLGHVQPGQHITLAGSWQEKALFGRQFKVRQVMVADPRTLRGLELYLSDGGVKGLGPTFARRVVERFGTDTLRIIDDEPEKLLEVAGIGQKRLDAIVEGWERDRAHREVHALLRGFGVGQALSNRIVDKFGQKAQLVVMKEPYRLAAEVRGVGFRTADAIAREVGISPDDPARADAATVHLLRTAESDGHTFLPHDQLLSRGDSLSVPAEAIRLAVRRLSGQGLLVVHPSSVSGADPVFSAELDLAEELVCEHMAGLLRLARLPAADTTPDEDALGLQLHAQQRQAVTTALQHGVCVVTGGPGTGKTTIVKVLLRCARRRGHQWLLAAPTGRASRRLAEATGSEAKTLHRLLEYNPRTGEFGKCGESRLEAEGVLVDEASMVDLRLMLALLEALPDGCRLVLVGDADQLPSVGAGRVLGDLIDSGAVPVATLTEVYRQAAGSGIVRNAWRIHRGESPVSGESDPEASEHKDFFVVRRPSADAALAAIVTIVSKRLPKLGFDPRSDIQVLTPMHGGPLGTERLNTVLQQTLNPDGVPLSTTRPFRVGDRVMQTRNNYDNDVFNGDVGVVEDVEGGVCTVDFDGQRVSLSGPELDDITLAYAISVHKSQGSEYPAVVMALHRSHRIMLRRNLIYTAMTRARRFCCMVGDPDAIARAASVHEERRRYSLLSMRLSGAPST